MTEEWAILMHPDSQAALLAHGEQVMPKVGGKSFRCDCGCNVFTSVGYLKYRCNSCGAHWQGED